MVIRVVMLNLFQHPYQMKKQPNKQTGFRLHGRNDGNKKGFTLIELLVVVLIIGILSAVALPQYQVAVLKSKMNSVLPLLRAVKDANEVYYLANGTYTDDLNALDVIVPAGNAQSLPHAGLVLYDNGTWMDQYVNTDAPAGNYRVFGGVYDLALGRGTQCTIGLYYDYSTEPGKRSCGGNYPHCVRVCKSLGF